MALASGTRLGAYEIVALIGAGGIGEVYRARDTRLGRDVAIKVLPEAFTGDTERLARFKREAQVLASLNDAHIGAIYGLEETPSGNGLVLELVIYVGNNGTQLFVRPLDQLEPSPLGPTGSPRGPFVSPDGRRRWRIGSRKGWCGQFSRFWQWNACLCTSVNELRRSG